MSTWRKMALELFPNYKDEIERHETRTDLWIFLNDQFIKAYLANDDEGAMSVVKFYRWCVSAETYPIPNDLQSDAVVNFIEDNISTDDGFRALFKYMSPNEILFYSSNIAYAQKLESYGEVLQWLCIKVRKLGLIIKCDEINSAIQR